MKTYIPEIIAAFAWLYCNYQCAKIAWTIPSRGVRRKDLPLEILTVLIWQLGSMSAMLWVYFH